MKTYGFNRIVIDDKDIPEYIDKEINLGLLHFIPTVKYLPITYAKLLVDIIKYANSFTDCPIYSLKELDTVAVDLILAIQYGLVVITEV